MEIDGVCTLGNNCFRNLPDAEECTCGFKGPGYTQKGEPIMGVDMAMKDGDKSVVVTGTRKEDGTIIIGTMYESNENGDFIAGHGDIIPKEEMLKAIKEFNERHSKSHKMGHKED